MVLLLQATVQGNAKERSESLAARSGAARLQQDRTRAERLSDRDRFERHHREKYEHRVAAGPADVLRAALAEARRALGDARRRVEGVREALAYGARR